MHRIRATKKAKRKLSTETSSDPVFIKPRKKNKLSSESSFEIASNQKFINTPMHSYKTRRHHYIKDKQNKFFDMKHYPTDKLGHIKPIEKQYSSKRLRTEYENNDTTVLALPVNNLRKNNQLLHYDYIAMLLWLTENIIMVGKSNLKRLF